SYSMKRWNELTVFLTDARLEIDNNKIENEIRPIALGRKNYLFAGTHESAQRIAMIYSLLACCKVNNVEPMGCLTHVLEDTPKRRVNGLQDWLPQRIEYPQCAGCLLFTHIAFVTMTQRTIGIDRIRCFSANTSRPDSSAVPGQYPTPTEWV